MLPEVVWNMPPMGTINVHGSLLPQYRGAAPINWAIINGEKQTGVTTFKLKHEIDTGDILLQEKIQIGETDTAGILHDRMKIIGAELLVRTIKNLAEGNIKEVSQDAIGSTEIKHAPKIFTDTCKIDWNKTVEEIYDLIRGLCPFPGAFTLLDNKMLKIFISEKEIVQHNEQAGNYKTDGKTFLKFAAKNGYILVTDMQLEGKKRIPIADFLRGYRFADHS
jgi:methionyl-tRNA formyltransferase